MRQYIGARYTTKIHQNSLDPGSCEWESGVIYEPLTIVSYQNSSYLSRTTVPANAGAPTVATQYWAQTGFYNGQIASLQQQIEDNLDMYLHKEYTHYGADNSKILFLADSFGLVNYGDWCNYVSTKMGGGVIIDATAGADLATYATKLKAIDDGTYTDILMVCGTNDIYTNYNDIVAKYTAFKAVATKFIKTKLHYGFCAVHYDDNNKRALIKPCCNLYRKMCGELGIRYLGNFNRFLYPAFQYVKGDGIHPNVLGGKRLASAIGKAFNNCCDIENGYQEYVSDDPAIHFKVSFDVDEDSLVHANVEPMSGTVSVPATYSSISIPTGNWQHYDALGNASFSIPCTYPGGTVFYVLNQNGFQWAATPAISTWQGFGWQALGTSVVDLDTIING